MLDVIGAAIDDAADRLARARDAEEAAEAEAAEAETVREPMVDERPASRMGHRKADGAIIGCGLASLVGGAALIGGGAWNFSKVDRQGSSRRAALEQAQLTEAEREDYRSELGDWQEQWRGTATGLVVAGSVLAAAGAGLMTWGLVRTQRGRGAKPRASSAAPVASREQVGVAMVMRF